MKDRLSALALPSRPGAFRFWLAALVVLHHLVGYEFGKIPVLVFFSLSGFWIHRLWQDSYSRMTPPVLIFLASRWLRIAPLLIAASLASLTVLVLMAPHTITDMEVHWRHLLVSSVLGLGYASLPVLVLGPAWSLDLEMQFYCVVPWLSPLVQRIAGVPAALCSLAVMAIAYAATLPTWMVFEGPFFFLGMCAAERRWSAGRPIALAGAAATGLLVVAAIFSPWHALLIDPDAPLADAFGHAVALLLLPAALASVAPREKQASDVAAARARDAMLGELSYVVYLAHWPLILIGRLGPWSGATGGAVHATLLMFGLPLVGGLAWRYLDRPCNLWRKRWVDKRRMAHGASHPASPRPASPRPVRKASSPPLTGTAAR
jgi:peptidoglycan/LPS O-acetylase OafA/YrhL